MTSSIAGPKTECADPAMRPLFDVMVTKAGFNHPTLDIGADHVAEEVKFLPVNGLPVDFRTIASDRFSGVTTARNVVVRDQAAFDALWAEHSAIRIPPAEAPKVDFKTEMVVALFGGNDSACASFGVRSAAAVNDRLVVYYERKDPDPAMACIAVVANPMQMIVVPRVDAPVDFVKISAQDVPFTDVLTTYYSNNLAPRNYVIKDAATLATVWKKTATSNALPVVDFGKDMLIAVFGMGGSSGCYYSKIESVYRTGGKLHVARVDWAPGPKFASACSQAFTQPAHLIKVARTDDAVEFSSQSKYLENK